MNLYAYARGDPVNRIDPDPTGTDGVNIIVTGHPPATDGGGGGIGATGSFSFDLFTPLPDSGRIGMTVEKYLADQCKTNPKACPPGKGVSSNEDSSTQSGNDPNAIIVTARPVPVCRAIDDFELTAMGQNGMRFVPSPGGLEVKYFWPRPDFAAAFGQEYIKQGWVKIPVHIVSATIPAGMQYGTVNVADLSKYGLGNVYAITVPNSSLYRISPAKVIGYIPFKRQSMRCIVNIKTSSPLDLSIGERCEYLCRFGKGNHFVSVIVDEVFPERGVILGNAQHLMGDIAGPMMGDVLGLDETDIRGWLLIL